jgi:hypothetical protein
MSLVIDAAGTIYVADRSNHRIQKFLKGQTSGTTVAGGNGGGNALSQFLNPLGVALDASGNIYVADQFNHRIQKWVQGATTGTTVAGGNGGSNANQFNTTTALVLDAAGNIYVADHSNHRIQKWAVGATSGTTVAGGNGIGSGVNQLAYPNGVTFDGVGNLYVADQNNHRIQKYDAATSTATFTPTQAGTITALVSNGTCSTTSTAVVVKASSISTTNISICPSQLPYSWNGSRTTTGIYTFTTTNSQGCDSLATLNLTIGNSTSSTTNITKCGNYLWNGVTYTASGVFNKLFTSNTGCDSIATLNLTILTTLPAITGASSVCVGASIQLSNSLSGGVWSSIAGRATVNASGVAIGTSQGTAMIAYKYTAGGCNLTATTSFAVNSLPNVPSIGYAVGTVNPQRGAGGAFCTNKTFTVVGTPSGGVWSSTGIITVGASAGVLNTGSSVGAASLTYTVTTNGCSNSRTITGNVVTCAARGMNGIENGKLKMENDFNLYPNPAKSFIRLNVETLMGAGTIVVTDLYGKQIKTQSLSMGTNTIDVSSFARGIYFISTITSEGKTTKKLIVE